MRDLIAPGFPPEALDDPSARQVMADYFEEGRDPVRAALLRGSVKRDADLPGILDDYDWKEVFGEGGGGNCGKQTDPCPPGSTIDTTPPNLADVRLVLATVNGDNDGPAWVGLFLLKDGRYLVADGSCDYTGWDCQAGNSLHVGATLDDVLQYGMTPDQRERLGIPAPPAPTDQGEQRQ